LTTWLSLNLLLFGHCESYSAGEAVTVTYTLENTGNVRLYSVNVTDTAAGQLNCINDTGASATMLAVGAKATCRCVHALQPGLAAMSVRGVINALQQLSQS
jgi:uncharacterized repeat protein (TIGR01451 family)